MSYARRKRLKQQLAVERGQRYDDQSLQKLKNEIRRSCQTIFVGAVAKMEEYFGDLWDENNALDEDDMTEVQRKWFYAFLDAREKIFDQGNQQLSVLLSKLDEYHVSLNKKNLLLLKKDCVDG